MSGKPPAVPLTYAIWMMARDMHLPPWLFESDDPLVSKWLLRSLLFWSFDKQAVKRSD